MNKLFSIIVILLLVNSTFGFKFQKCEDCVDFVDNSINDMLQIILNGGVIGGCGDICEKLPTKYAPEACDLICAYLGLEEFVKLIGEADPDPIYICELTKICTINPDAAATMDLVQINPMNGTVDGTFTISIAFTVTNEIGTGEIAFDIIDPIGNMIGDAQLLVNQQPNQYTTQFQFQATPSEQEYFPPGEYQLQAAICEGSCGSIHKYTYTLATGNVNFTINAKAK